MISNYEIRENSLTANSVFILLIKGDEQGCEDVLKEFQDICVLIDEKVDNFDYVFELAGITDDYMLEKIGVRLDVLSSSVLGISQTFDNANKTKTISIDKQTTNGGTNNKGNTPENDVNEATYTQRNKEMSINLSDPGFVLSKENTKETDFKDIKTSSSLVLDDEQSLVIEETSSLKITKAIPGVKQEIPVFPLEQEKEQQPQENKLSEGEKEAQNIDTPSPEEVKDVPETVQTAQPVQKEKTSFLGSFFGKLKSILGFRKDETEEQKKEEKTVVSKEQANISDLIKNAKDNKPEQGKPAQKEIKKLDNKSETSQDIREDFTVKKAILSTDETLLKTKKPEKTTTGSVKAQLQIDDIFAAETICDFYGDQQEEYKKEKTDVFKHAESPLEKLEKGSSKKEYVIEEMFEEQQMPDETQIPEEIIEQESQKKIENTEKKNTKTKETVTSTVPTKIFTQENREKKPKPPVIPPNKKSIPKTNAAKTEKHSAPGIGEVEKKQKTFTSKGKEKTKTEDKKMNL